MSAWLIFLCISSTTALATPLNRTKDLFPLRIEFFMLKGEFHKSNRDHLDSVLPLVKEFYSNLLSVNRLESPLKPLKSTCGSIDIPEDHLKNGVESDVIIYLYSNFTVFPALGKPCEQDGGLLKRPVIGHISISPNFFKLQGLQFEYLLRETAHVLAYDQNLFKDFVKHNGNPYPELAYSTEINYQGRGKTVKALAFPKMLEKARKFFGCEIQGLDLEDFYKEEESIEVVFWDSRVVIGDIMSSEMSPYPVFSDISIAIFEDSNWYLPDYKYSQNLRIGKNEGCRWFKEKCVKEGKANLPGFCDSSTELNICDSQSLGYGNCYLLKSQNIPPSEQYFADASLGGLGPADFCPTVIPSHTDLCRASFESENPDTGEFKGYRSMCLMGNLAALEKKDYSNILRGGCYEIRSCGVKSVSIKVGDQIIDCPYNSSVKVKGFQGNLFCPKQKEFCTSVPCPGMCSGKGLCMGGKCICNAGLTGEVCELKCPEFCKMCSNNLICGQCFDGYYLNKQTKNCKPCPEACSTCFSPLTCNSCKDGFELKGVDCISGCKSHCSSCDDPCTTCDPGYFAISGGCEKCNENCKECLNDSETCTSCNEDLKLINNKCQLPCDSNCVVCESPCTKCKDSYFIDSGFCTQCDTTCLTCENSPGLCTSCYEGYSLNGNHCTQICSPNCLSCDNPCSVCEDGFFAYNGLCSACDESCLTCDLFSNLCKSCKIGFLLKGSNCVKSCVEHCKVCQTVCEECETGYFEQDGLCLKCHESCLDCSSFEECVSCAPGYGMVGTGCMKGCNDHCVSCDSPCSKCDPGYYRRAGLCFKCDDSCLTCKFSGNENCIDCAEGYFLRNGKCVTECQDNCLSCDEPCSICEEGYFSYKLGCKQCKTGCKTCSSFTHCNTCQPGYGLVYQNCVPSCTDHCITCDIPCTSCQPLYFPSDGVCKSCATGCKTCKDSPENCVSCVPGFVLNEKYKCVEGCIENCINCNSPCEACQPGFTLIEGYCFPCLPGCASCSPDLTKCYSCQEGYSYSEYTCQKNCLPNCLSCDEPCTKCEFTHLAVQGKCLPCEHPCKTCQNQLDFCTSCLPNYDFTEFKCVSKCKDHCSSCDVPCSQCEDGFFINNGLCAPCSESCRSCQGSSNNCTSCLVSQKLVNGKCEKRCIENCIDCSFPCRSCIFGFELMENTCVSCQNYLKNSDGKAELIRDYTGLAISFSKPIKNRVNSCQNYFKPETIAFLGTDPLCSWENDSRFIVLFGKNFNIRIKTLAIYPLASFGSNCSSNASDIHLTILSIPKPFVSLSVPSFVSLDCPNTVLIIQGFTEEKLYSFTFSTNPVSAELENYLNSLISKTLIVPQHKLVSTTLSVTFKATNFNLISSEETKIVQIVKEKKLAVSIDAGSRLKVKSSESFFIHGQVQNSCFDSQKIEFFWDFKSTDPGDHEGYQVSSGSKGSNQLYIPLNVLRTGKQYLFIFSAKAGAEVAKSDILIEVFDSPLVAVINRQTASAPISDKLEISAKDSFDPSDPGAVLKFEWECYSDGVSCVGINGGALVKEKNLATLSVASYAMKANKLYEFSVKISRENRISRKTVDIYATNSKAFIQVPSFFREVNVGEDVFVYPKYFGVNEECFFDWKQVKGFAVVPESEKSKEYLVVSKDSMAVDQVYAFNLTGECEGEKFYSEVSWKTYTVPICKSISAEALGGVVSMSTDCENYSEHPLYYVYGVVLNERIVPLKVLNSPSALLNLKPGNWIVFVEACNNLRACSRLRKDVYVGKRRLENIENNYSVQKKYTDGIPVGVVNNVELFGKEDFFSVFSDFVGYIKGQEADMVHLRMSIEILELLARSNKSSIMWDYQDEITEFLEYLVGEVEEVSEDVMNSLVDLYSKHPIKTYQKVSMLFNKFSAKWMSKHPPGKVKSIKNTIQVTRHRFIESDSSFFYESDRANVSNFQISIEKNHVYDIVVLFYLAEPSPVIDIYLYDTGLYKDLSFSLFDEYKNLRIDLLSPLNLEFSTKETEFKCQQFKGTNWADDSCNVTKISDQKVQLTAWISSTFRLTPTTVVHVGNGPIIIDVILLIICVVSVFYFYVVDNDIFGYAQGLPDTPKDQKEIPSQKNEESEKKKEEKAVLTKSVPNTRVAPIEMHHLLFHPWLNILYQQSGKRRIASVLHFFSVIAAEFLLCGLSVHPKFGEILDGNNAGQVLQGVRVLLFGVGVIFIQIFSAFIACSNKPLGVSMKRRIFGMVAGAVTFLVCLGLGFIFALSFPARNGFYWMIGFAVTALSEVLVFQNAHWLIFRREGVSMADMSATRNVRVFTTEA